MNWKRIDGIRRRSTALENDLIDHYVAGTISRRNFVRRGTILGLTLPTMGAIIAACGGDDDDGDSGGAAAETRIQTESTGTKGGDLIAAIQQGDANSGLDPLNMLDLGTYSVLSQSFEYLVGLADDGNIGSTALATGWSTNDDATQWTFNLREGVLWQDGSPFTAADVAATIDRMISVGAGLTEDAVSTGSTEVVDDVTVRVNLNSANGNLPVLLSIYNPQSLITPVDYDSGTLLNDRPAGTGPWVLDSFDPVTFNAKFVPNTNWWGGEVNLDSIELQGFDSGGTAVAAMAAREVDMIQNFAVADGQNLLDDENLELLNPPSANHRQLWFNTQIPADGPFANKLVRQAVGHALNREQMVNVLFRGRAIVANDHPVHPTLPFFDASQEQRAYDPDRAKELLSEAGYGDGVSSTLQTGDIAEIPDLAAIVEQNLAEVGITTPVNVTPNADFYGEYWCAGASWGAQPDTGGPGVPCGASADIGIVDYGHRPTPDIYFGRALATDGDWNSSNFANSEFDQLFTDYQSAADVDGQKTAVAAIQELLHDEMPAAYPFFYDYLSAHDSSVSGVRVTALGHMQFDNASKDS